MKPTAAILLGAGQRGAAPMRPPSSAGTSLCGGGRAQRRAPTFLSKKTRYPNAMCFSSWEDLLAKDKLADSAFICTMDKMHVEAIDFFWQNFMMRYA